MSSRREPKSGVSHNRSDRRRKDRGDREYNEFSNSNRAPPVILAKPERKEINQANQEQNQFSNVSNETRSVLMKKESSVPKEQDSPKPVKPTREAGDFNDRTNYYIPPRNLKLIDDEQFCEPCKFSSKKFLIVNNHVPPIFSERLYE